MNKIKNFFAMVVCGISAITIFPQTDYSKNIPNCAEDIMTKSGDMMFDAWKMTGTSLQNSIEKEGSKVE